MQVSLLQVYLRFRDNQNCFFVYNLSPGPNHIGTHQHGWRLYPVPHTDKLTIALIQMAMTGSVADNLDKAERMIENAASRGAQIICLPELFSTLYFPIEENVPPEPFTTTIPGNVTERMAKAAVRAGAVVIAPVYEKTSCGQLFNTAVVIDMDGSIIGNYRKLHIPHDPSFYEQNFFAPGDLGYVVIHHELVSFAVLICFDQWFPEAARAAALGGAELIFYPTAIGALDDTPMSEGDWRDAWVTIQRAHAIANGVHVAPVNRVGREGSLEFWGSSFVSGPFGTVMAAAPSDSECVLVAQIDIAENRVVRDGWGFLRNRRPDTYSVLIDNVK